jgi:steroid 5-alpha reductase family enzyme
MKHYVRLFASWLYNFAKVLLYFAVVGFHSLFGMFFLFPVRYAAILDDSAEALTCSVGILLIIFATLDVAALIADLLPLPIAL